MIDRGRNGVRRKVLEYGGSRVVLSVQIVGGCESVAARR